MTDQPDENTGYPNPLPPGAPSLEVDEHGNLYSPIADAWFSSEAARPRRLTPYAEDPHAVAGDTHEPIYAETDEEEAEIIAERERLAAEEDDYDPDMALMSAAERSAKWELDHPEELEQWRLAEMGPLSWRTCPPEERGERLRQLEAWVDWLIERYAIGVETIPPCWWKHGALFEELTALWGAYLESVDPNNTRSAPAVWHQTLDLTLARLRAWASRRNCKPTVEGHVEDRHDQREKDIAGWEHFTSDDEFFPR